MSIEGLIEPESGVRNKVNNPSREPKKNGQIIDGLLKAAEEAKNGLPVLLTRATAKEPVDDKRKKGKTPEDGILVPSQEKPVPTSILGERKAVDQLV